MKYLAVCRNTAAEIISDRFLQSVDFDAGLALTYLLKEQIHDAQVSARLRLHRAPDGGLFILPILAPSADFVVFDLEAAALFDRPNDAEVLLIFQKLLRFAMRHWENLKLSIAERKILGTTRVAIFPFPISQHTSFRVMVELSPDSKRLEKRTSAKHLLVYKCGTDEGEGRKETVSVNNFRRFLVSADGLRKEGLAENQQNQKGSKALAVTELDENRTSHLDAHIGYDNWRQYLTKKQLAFVDSKLEVPHRVEGPAGTGKTLCLVLKCIATLKAAELGAEEHRSLFVTHSEATRRSLQAIFQANDPAGFAEADRLYKLQTVELTTLQQLCGRLLNREISETEFIDRDAMESKQLQLLYVSNAFDDALSVELDTHKKFLSSEFIEFLSSTDRWVATEMLQHEFSVIIKGRAEERLDAYRKLPRLRYGLPVASDSDRGFVFLIFKKYQSALLASGQFDTDDIVLTTIGQLDTPIWRRRRAREGYDSIFIDETHLFNVNELSLFHHLPKSQTLHPIAYSIDRSQAVGDRGWTDELFDDALVPGRDPKEPIKHIEIRNVFRCSPDIVDLAFSVTSSGATLFTNFENPMNTATSMFTSEEERMCSFPIFREVATDEEQVIQAFASAERMVREMQCSRAEVAIVGFSDELFKAIASYATEHNKPVEVLKQRGDTESLNRAKISGRFIISAPDYVGGLEFNGIVLVGVDEGRVPPDRSAETIDSSNFLSYASHSRLYVAITRARFQIEILVSAARGPSKLLRGAIERGLLEKAA